MTSNRTLPSDLHGLRPLQHIDLNEIQRQHDEDTKTLNQDAFRHILELTFSYLSSSAKDLATCRLVCKSWKMSIDNFKPWYILQFKMAYSKGIRIIFDDALYMVQPRSAVKTMYFLDQFPYWIETFKYFEAKATLVNVKKITAIFLPYFQSKKPTRLCPVMSAMFPETNYEILQFLRDETLLDFNKVANPICDDFPLLHYPRPS